MDKRESNNLEKKSSLSDLDRIVEIICSFANKKGGEVLIGVNNDDSIKGVQVGKDTIEKISNKIINHIDPNIYPEIEIENKDGKDIIKIKVDESKNKPHTAFSKPFIRIGDTTRVMKRDEYEKLLLEKNKYKMYFDEQICEGASIKNIDEEKVKWFLEKASYERRLNIEPKTPVKEALERLKLTKNNELTNASVLLFGKNPQEFFMQSETRCARFKGTEPIEFIDMKIFGGNIIDQVDNAEKFVLSHIKKAAKIVMFKREEVWEYPPNAIREAIVNAVCHRDYFIQSNIKISIFDNRIEISDPGKLPEPLTPSILKEKHDSILRNPLIANCFFLIKNIEQWGKGTNKIVNWCIEHGLREPDFKEIGGGFEVIFYAPEDILKLIPEKGKMNLKELGLNERQIKALKLMVNERKKFYIKDYIKEFNISKRTAIRDFEKLVKKGFVIKIGTWKGAYFIAKGHVTKK